MYKITFKNSKNFSSFSKDKNLIHLSKDFASKFFFKQPIVHGVNIALLALKKYLNKNKKIILINYISINFKNYILLDEPFEIKIFTDKILVFNNVNIKLIILIKKKIINKKNNLYKNHASKRGRENWNKYLLNFQLMEHLISISKIIGSKKPGNGSLIHKINTKYNKNKYHIINKKIKFDKIIKNLWSLHYSEKFFVSNIITTKLVAYNRNKENITITKITKKKIFQKKILIIGSSGDIGYQLKKSFEGSGCLLFNYSFKINETSPIFTDLEKKKISKFILKIKPNFIFYLSSSKIYHDNKKNGSLAKLYNIIYCDFLKHLLKTLLQFKIQSRIFYPSSIALNDPKKFKYLHSYILAKNKGEKICKYKKYKKLVRFFRLPQFKTRSNYNMLGHYEGKNLSLLSKYLNKFFY
jgi:hypothetical protein